MRGNLLDELRKPYVITARAKGRRSRRKLLLKYPVRLAINPLDQHDGLWLLPEMFSGSTLVADRAQPAERLALCFSRRSAWRRTCMSAGQHIAHSWQQSDHRRARCSRTSCWPGWTRVSALEEGYDDASQHRGHALREILQAPDIKPSAAKRSGSTPRPRRS